MTEILLTIFFISVLLFFLGSGIWVALSMIGVSAIGMMLFTSRPVGDAMATTIWGTSSSWTLTALPLFVWMGEILFRTKLSENLFKGLSPWMQKLPGGLIICSNFRLFSSNCCNSRQDVYSRIKKKKLSRKNLTR